MLLLKMRRAKIDDQPNSTALACFQAVVAEASDVFRPIISRLRKEQATYFSMPNLTFEDMGSLRRGELFLYHPTLLTLDAEIFLSDDYGIALTLELRKDGQDVVIPNQVAASAGSELRICAYAFGQKGLDEGLELLSEIVLSKFGKPFDEYRYNSERFDAVSSEVTDEKIEVDANRIIAANILSNKVNRALATAIKSSGGLLMGDVAKQLPTGDRSRAEEIKSVLTQAGLATVELVVICGNSKSQVARVGERSRLKEFSEKGLKCACGKPIDEEGPEELLTITPEGSFLIDKSRWMSVLVKHRLLELGVPSSDILLECQLEGDEIDCLANVSGELVMFELKDKEFSLRDAYSFGAKMGLMKPKHSVVMTTEYVGNDVKQHFKRSMANETNRRYGLFEDRAETITYIEGLDAFESQLSEFVTTIYRKDAARILSDVLSKAVPSAKSFLDLFESPKS